MDLTKQRINQFQHTVIDYYIKHKRNLLWRETIDPYWVVVSEIMLQQTQVSRVKVKFPQFIQRFPSFAVLAHSSLTEVLSVWQGMGYNRRGKYLRLISQKMINEYDGSVPDSTQVLETFPGIGPATAGAIATYIYNKPYIFIETNIRRVMIHHFFSDKEFVDDKEIFPIIKATIDKLNPREWYYALMDYSTMLSKNVPNLNSKSKHYSKQTRFEGSDRQIRGEILRLLIIEKSYTTEELLNVLPFKVQRVYNILDDLEREGFVREDRGKYEMQG